MWVWECQELVSTSPETETQMRRIMWYLSSLLNTSQARLLKADISRTYSHVCLEQANGTHYSIGPITLRCDECLERRSYSPPHDDPTGGIAGPCSRSGEKRFQTNRSASPR